MESYILAVVIALVSFMTFEQSVRGQSTLLGGGGSSDLWTRLEMLETKVLVGEKKAVSAENRAVSAEKRAVSAETRAVSAENSVKELKLGQSVKSCSYVRWGRTTCNGNGTTLVYKGFTAGSFFLDRGNGANYVCLTEDPTWEYDSVGRTAAYATIHGTEYEVSTDWPLKRDNVSPGKVFQQAAPCAVCETVGRGSALMIPGTHVCPQGWSQEYTGYLMTAESIHQRSEYVCVDGIPEGVAGGGSHDFNGALFHYVRTICGSLPCGPYLNDRETTCVVCSK